LARKNVLKPYKMIDGGDLSSNITSSTTSVINLDKASISISWSGSSPVGTIEVEARNGEADPWTALDFGGSTISISGNSGSHRILLNETPFTDVRVSYTATSGTGTIDAIITAKQVGG
jgi:hypothetical protein